MLYVYDMHLRKTRYQLIDLQHALPQKDGYLVKKGEVVKNWKKRWFVLHGSLLCYFKKPPGKVCVTVLNFPGSIG